MRTPTANKWNGMVSAPAGPAIAPATSVRRGATTAAEVDRPDEAPLVAHVIYRLAAGGLENGLVNVINGLSEQRFRHAVICLKDYTEFRSRIERQDVGLYALNKPDGKQIDVYFRLWALLRRLRPQIVHTRNLGALDCAFIAALAGVAHRIHGEHGWDMVDLHGTSRKYRLLRRAANTVVERYVTVSEHLAAWLSDDVGIRAQKVEHICNGVDTTRFRPGTGQRPSGAPDFLADPDALIIGTVGRMETVKDPCTLVRTFIHLLDSVPDARSRLRLIMVGDGSLRGEVQALLEQAGAGELAWLPGERDDIASLLRTMDVFVLPSLNEGISNTILEAMATGLPVIATRVGGNSELVQDGRTGSLVEAQEPVSMAQAVQRYALDGELRERHGREARERVEREFSLDVMVARYGALYARVLGERTGVSAGA